MSGYGKMTVAELREELLRKGGNAPKGAKKAELVEMLEAIDRPSDPVEVEAEVMEGREDLAVTFNAGTISANFDALEARVDALLAEYDGWEPSAESKDDVEQCARERKYLNGLAKQVDERRKAVKNAYEQPLKAFEARCNGIRDKIKAVSGRISSVEKEADEFRRSEKKNELREHYEAFAGVLLSVVPYEKIHDERWLNKGYQLQKAKGDIEEAVRRIANEWDQLKSLGLEFQAEAEARYFDVLNLGDAIAWAGKLAEDKRRVEAMKAELEPVAGDEATPMQESACRPEIKTVPCTPARPIAQPIQQPVQQPYGRPIPARPIDAGEMEKERVLADIATVLRGYRLRLLENLLESLQAVQADSGEALPRIMVIDYATQGQLGVIGRFCGLVGVTGTFKRGTLAEVAAREAKRIAQESDPQRMMQHE